jgi:hypothetical protein
MVIVTAQRVKQIRVKGNLVGIVGLPEVMEAMKPDSSEQSDEVIGKEMISRLSAHNYIPDSARENYVKALVRDFEYFLDSRLRKKRWKGWKY